ncbi:uncharacterized protein [Nicotiana sylvestris]|uniref:uncharacterized protein n=1 Tax=Nicotiana sylvestris TaxID=4096 RepID=UPI00388CDC34
MTSYEYLYGRRCHYSVGWFEPEKARLLGTDFVYDALEKVKLIQEWLRAAQSRKKSYADRKARDVSFMVGEKVLLRVLPIKGVTRFGKKGKFIPQYIGPFEVLKGVGEVTYRLSLPPSLSGVHLMLHFFMLQKYYEDPSHELDFCLVQLIGNLTYDEELVDILDRQVRKRRSNNITSEKVQWRGQLVEEVTWETEHDMWSKYHNLFDISGMILNLFEDERLFKSGRM